MVEGTFTVAHLSDVWLGYRDKVSLRKMSSDSLDGKAVPVRELDVYVAWDSAISGVIADGADAVGAAEAEQPDLILLDLMLPGMNGIDVCRTIRETSTVPIVMLTAKTDTVDVVLGLESGADDYVNKPFKAKELVARIRARLRRTEDEVSDVIELGDLTIDVAGHQVRRGNEEIPLTPLEYELLLLLARKPRQVVSREELLTSIWGLGF